MHGPTCIFWANLIPFSLQGQVPSYTEGKIGDAVGDLKTESERLQGSLEARIQDGNSALETKQAAAATQLAALQAEMQKRMDGQAAQAQADAAAAQAKIDALLAAQAAQTEQLVQAGKDVTAVQAAESQAKVAALEKKLDSQEQKMDAILAALLAKAAPAVRPAEPVAAAVPKSRALRGRPPLAPKKAPNTVPPPLEEEAVAP